MSESLFGDYSLAKERGRWLGRCSHCGRSTKPRPSVGQAEASIRGHLSDVHHLSKIRRDARETTRWLS